MINLLEISKTLALKAKKLQEKCLSQYPKPLIIPAKTLKKQIPDLAKLPSELTLFQMLKREKSPTFKVSTIAVYQKDKAVVVVTPDLEVLEDFEIVNWKTGLGGRVTLKHSSGIKLIAAIICSSDHLNQLQIEDEKFLEGDGEPPIEYLKAIPQPETPLHSPILPRNEILEVVTTGRKTKQFSTPLVDLKDSAGNVYRDVITNSELQQLLLDYGNGVKFEILEVREYTTDKDSNTRHYVDILRVGSENFSDLEI